MVRQITRLLALGNMYIYYANNHAVKNIKHKIPSTTLKIRACKDTIAKQI